MLLSKASFITIISAACLAVASSHCPSQAAKAIIPKRLGFQFSVFGATDCMPGNAQSTQHFSAVFADNSPEINSATCATCFTLSEYNRGHVESLAFASHFSDSWAYLFYDEACSDPVKHFTKEYPHGREWPIRNGKYLDSTTNSDFGPYRAMYHTRSVLVCRMPS
ncbi:hypothetical protein BV22DRAFT_1128626 [Leucogyrophana mollusca]|uniref:Uncharacterized protein n=1 Tax=Leucogyrophana mollusca TaxID=85980 RepID=A0ACB8BKX7_9AGAM|nr:hypothetical protein BV22DRAFT_1128626 [Leucogyrophana mollusca]